MEPFIVNILKYLKNQQGEGDLDNNRNAHASLKTRYIYNIVVYKVVYSQLQMLC